MTQLTRLSLAVATTLATSATFAAGLDRSGQDTTAFFQDGLYAEAVYTYIDGDVTGYDNANGPSTTYAQGNEIDNIVETYDFFRFAVKDDINDRVSVGVLYDEPWGAAVQYTGENNFVATDADTAISTLTDGAVPSMAAVNPTIAAIDAGIGQIDAGIAQLEAGITQAEQAGATDQVTALTAQLTALTEQKTGLETQKTNVQSASLAASAQGATEGESTHVEVRSNSLTGIMGYKFGENKNYQVYGGPVLQRLYSDISLRGLSYSGLTGHDAHLSPSNALGWLAGVAYYKPEIALKASLTYRSEIDHEANMEEFSPVGEALGATMGIDNNHVEITTPESINLDFQTGLNQTTLATAHVRYVPWSDFSIVPPDYNATTKLRPAYADKGLPIVAYDDDQWKVELGLAKRLNEKLAVSGNIGWDSGAGNPVTSLGPIEGYYSAGLGAKYNLTDNWAVSAGGKYLWFGDAEAMVPSRDIVGSYEDNTGFVAGVKLSYQEK